MDPLAHFIREGSDTYVGNHLIVDLWGVKNHHDPESIMCCFKAACEDAQATVLFDHCHMFGDNEGYTGVVVLSESHLSFHTYFEVSLVSLDIYMCGSANPDLALPRIKDFWQPKLIERHHMRRGQVLPHKVPTHVAALLT
jgi:S-adenosylmethionine decarboxylase